MIIADFSEGLSELTTEKLYQWDIGQQLQISGISAANGDMQVHFANPVMKQAIVKDGEYSGGVLTVDIPNEFLQVGGSVPGRAWLYCYDADSKAKTVKTIYIPIVARNRPNDYVSPEDPDSKGIVDRAMELLENYETDLAGKLSSAAGAVKTANIDTGAVTEAKLATDSVATAKIKDSNVTEAKLAANSVTTAKIKDGNVTEAKLAAAFKNTLYKVDTTARSNITSADIDSKKIYTNFTINYNGANRKAIVMNFDSTQTFIALCADGMIFTRTVGAGWQCIYNPNDKTTSITNSNKSSNILFPTIKAVVDYLTANYIGNGSGTVTENNLATALKNSLYHVDNTTETVVYSADNPRTIYTNARVCGNKPTLVFTLFDDSQLAMHKDGHLYCRTFANGAYGDWIDLKAISIMESNKTSGAYPTVRAVYNFVTTFVASAISSKADTTYVDNRLNSKADSSALTAKENLSNKITTGENLLINKNSTDKYPAAKAIVDYIAALFATVINNDNKSSNALLPTIKAVVDYLTANYTNTTTMNERLSRKMDTAYAEDLRNKVNELDISIEPDPDDMEYPSAYAVWMIANHVYNDLSLDISGNSAKISGNSADIADNSADIADIQAYLGYTSPDILGLCVDLENNRFTRLAGAEGLDAGSDFDDFPMFGGRRRCCVANDGTINAYYGEQGYAEDGTNGQIMVYQPKFYYRMVPLKLEKQASGLGYHIRKANYYVTANPRPGFKLHPLFYDANGKEIDYVLLSAYEGSMYDVSESAYVNDSVDTSVSYGAGDLLCSVAGKKPISGKLDGVGSKAQFETMANNIGPGWHLNTIKAENANQLLMMIELGTLNMQTAVGRGVVDQSGSSNASSLTGSTASLGNATGMASSTIAESAGTETTNTTNGKLSVSYRGVENPWGNIWEHTNGINLWGDGTMGGGQVFICDDFTYNESKHDGNYQSAGFSVADAGGYGSAFGYGSEDYDWVLMPSETAGNSSLPVGDNFWCTSNLNGYRIAQMGGYWLNGDSAGGFCSHCSNGPGTRYYAVGGRLLYVPTASV